jgi:hypothetical protein
MHFINRLSALIFLVVLIAACASAPDIVSTDKAEGERYSADEIRRRTVDQPFLLSGDFFRERERDPETTFNLGKAFSASKRDKKEQDEEGSQKATPAAKMRPAPETTTPPEEAASPAPAPKAQLDHPIKVAAVFDPAAVPEDRRQRVRSVLTEAAPDHPVVVADEEKVREMLATSDCLEKRDLRCIAERLGSYPGVRMLMLVEAFQWPDTLPGQALARISLVDTGLGYRYPPLEISAAVQEAAFLHGFIEGVLHQVMGFAVKKSQIMPWFCRAFSTEAPQAYVSAGEKSGLKVGDVLSVATPGKLVASPTGLPAGWVPGKVEGKVRVETLFGEDFAVCSLTEGRMPAPGDLLMSQ